MTEQTQFCARCGKPINTGASFCMACGARIVSRTAATAGMPPQVISTARPTQRKRPSILIMLIGLILILIGLRGPAALLFGTATTGTIVNVEQEINSTSDRMDYNYQITYEFWPENGKRQTGSYNMNKVFNISSLPGEGESLSVKYLPFLPFINTPAGQGNPGLAMIILCGLGVLLIVLGAKGSKFVNVGRRDPNRVR